jgi:hypothetical protein
LKVEFDFPEKVLDAVFDAFGTRAVGFQLDRFVNSVALHFFVFDYAGYNLGKAALACLVGHHWQVCQ